MGNDALLKYVNLIQEFLSKRIDAATFEASYLTMFKNETVAFGGATFEILDGVFNDVDAFCQNPALRGPNDLDEDQLRDVCRSALKRLEPLIIAS